MNDISFYFGSETRGGILGHIKTALYPMVAAEYYGEINSAATTALSGSGLGIVHTIGVATGIDEAGKMKLLFFSDGALFRGFGPLTHTQVGISGSQRFCYFAHSLYPNLGRLLAARHLWTRPDHIFLHLSSFLRAPKQSFDSSTGDFYFDLSAFWPAIGNEDLRFRRGPEFVCTDPERKLFFRKENGRATLPQFAYSSESIWAKEALL